MNETDGWTASQPIWPAAGRRGEGGPDLGRRDTSDLAPKAISGKIRRVECREREAGQA